MATSTIKFYKINIPKDTNALIDDIETLLASNLKETINDYQYVRNDLDITLKFNKNQSNVNNLDINYCKIVNSDDTNNFYYFITKVQQNAQSTLIISLRMDTVNTLANASSYCNPRNFLSTTEIERQHMDRFKKKTGWNPSVGGFLTRNIDKESEGLVPNKIKESDTAIVDSSANYDWYLIYRSQEQTSTENPNPPIDTLLVASEPLVISKTGGSATRTLTTTDLPEGQYNYVLENDNPSASFSARCEISYEGTPASYATRTFTIGGEVCTVETITTPSPLGPVINGYQEKIYRLNNLKFVNTGNAFAISMDLTFLRNGTYHTYTGSPHNITFSGYKIDNASFSSTVPTITVNSLNFSRTSNDGGIPFEYVQAIVSSKVQYNIGPVVSRLTIGIDSVDRTDSRLIKIVKLPYCPIAFTKTGDLFNFGNDWIYDLGLLKFNGGDGKVLPQFNNSGRIRANIGNNDIWCNIGVPSATHIKTESDINLESKLFHSDFRTVKLVYDSFVKDVKLEYIDSPQTIPQTNVPITFKPTSTINSKFGFKLEFANTNVGTLIEDEDFAVLLSTRNNEETILNSEYLNYIKTGFNYDKKANALQLENQQRQATVSTVTSVLSLLGTIASFAAAPATGGASIAGGIGLAASTIATGVNAGNQWTNISKTKEAQESAMQSKLAQLAAQSTSTSGTDDVDLMSWYSANRLHLIKYNINTNIRNKIWKLLDHTGYAHSVYATPDVTSRIWYNYIQCIPEIDYEGTKMLKTEWIADLKDKYKNGVTVFHNRNSQYDLDRQYENYEKWIIGE